MESTESSLAHEKKTIREPLLSSAPNGGFRTLPFIIANEAFERVASFGLLPNMVVYLTREYGVGAARAANILFIWSAVTNFTPIIGAFVADSYVGRFWMIGFGSIISLMGMFLLWLSAMFPQARPPPCAGITCKSATTSQLLLLYSSFGLMSIGAGGIRSSSLAFGADQLNTNNNVQNAVTLQKYFSWYYATSCSSAFIAVTCIVYMQDVLGWKVGFGIPVLLMFMSTVCFFLASRFYVKLKPRTSLLTSLAQVFIASYRNRHVKLSSNGANEEYYRLKASKFLVPSENLRFLNKACVIRSPQRDLTSYARAANPWSLCTVDQVESLKALIRVMPMWSTGIMLSVSIAQNSFPVLQASTMNRHITPTFEIPAGSFSMFMIISLVTWVAVYDQIILPLASKFKGKPVRLSLKQRMGIGLICSCISMAALAAVEGIRREVAIQEGLSDRPHATVHLSAMWLLPYNVFCGLAEALNGIGQTEFFYHELPKAMSSVASNLFVLGISAASLLASFITSAVDDVTRGGGESWVSSNINKGHLDYYYWLLAGLSVLNFMYFLVCSKAYGPCKGDEAKISSEDDEMLD